MLIIVGVQYFLLETIDETELLKLTILKFLHLKFLKE